jgi:hypothetical protein
MNEVTTTGRPVLAPLPRAVRDGAVRYVLLQNGFRPFNPPSGAIPASAGNATDANSFRTWVVNVPSESPIAKIELLDTPTAWNGLPASAAVRASR